MVFTTTLPVALFFRTMRYVRVMAYGVSPPCIVLSTAVAHFTWHPFAVMESMVGAAVLAGGSGCVLSEKLVL